MINSTWKTVIIALATSVVTIGAYKIIDNHTGDVVLNEAASKGSKNLVNFADLPAGQPGDFVYAASVSTPSVVHIKAKATRQVRQQSSVFDMFGFDEDFFGGPRSQNQESSGSGVIISEDGYIVTNNHVVEGSEELEVVTYDKKSYTAKIIGVDPSTDIAVIKVEAKKLPAMTFGNSDEVKVGEWVLAVGNPFNLESTVTAGIVSAMSRSINIIGRGKKAGDNSAAPIESFIQTDAAVNPGNSGGALVNLSGNLIGINTAIASPNGAYAGYSFAVPSSIVKKVSTDLIKFGNVQRGILGITMIEINRETAKEIDTKLESGIFVNGLVDGGGAQEAGIKEGDVILKVDGVDATEMPKFLELIGRKRPSDKAILTINRDGKIKDYAVTLKNTSGGQGIVKKEIVASTFNKIGIDLEEISAKDKTKIGIRNGVRISNIKEGGYIGKETNIEKGFIITRVGNARVNSVKEVKDAIDMAKKNGEEGVLICGIYEDSVSRNYCTGVPVE